MSLNTTRNSNGLKSNNNQSNLTKSNTTQSSTSNNSTSKSNTTQSSTTQSSTSQNSGPKSSTTQSSASQSRATQSSTTQSSGLKSSTTQSSASQSRATQSSTTQSSGLKSSTTQSSTTQSRATQSSTTQSSGPKSSASQSSTSQNRTTQSGTPKSSTGTSSARNNNGNLNTSLELQSGSKNTTSLALRTGGSVERVQTTRNSYTVNNSNNNNNNNNNSSNQYNDRILSKVNVERNYENEIGANVVKNINNTIVTIRETAIKVNETAEKIDSAFQKTAAVISMIPEAYTSAKVAIKSIPASVGSTINTIKTIPRNVVNTTISIKRATSSSIAHLKNGQLKSALKDIKLDKFAKASALGITRLAVNTGKFGVKYSLKGARMGGKYALKGVGKGIVKGHRAFRQSVTSSNDPTANLGIKAIYGTVDTISTAKRTVKATYNAANATVSAAKNTAKAGANGVKAAKNSYNTLKTTTKDTLKSAKKLSIKTKQTSKRIAANVKRNFNKFKNTKITRKEIKKYINKLKNKFKDKLKDLFKKLTATIFKNPVVWIVIAVILLVTIIVNMIGMFVTAIFGISSAYVIDMNPNQQQWISSMKRLDSYTKRDVDGYQNVKTVRNYGDEPDWRDVIIAYYMKNNNSTSLAGGMATTIGGEVVTVEPGTWEKIFEKLKSYLGTDYYYGGCTPETGFDCSGLVQYCYGQNGISLPRTTYEQVYCGNHVEYSDLQPGDLVFFGTSDNVHHVGVYIGNGQYLQAPQTGDVVKINNLNHRNDFYEARRVFKVKEEEGTESTEETKKPETTDDKILYKALPDHAAYVDIFYKVSAETGVDAVLLASIAMQESTLNPNCVSHAGASGLCQLMPATFVGLGFDISLIFDPYTNVKACAYEVLQLYKYSCITSVEDMLTAYNGGIGNFMKYNGPIPGNPENTEYNGKVLSHYSQLSNGEKPSVMEGGSISINSVNTQLEQIYRCFVKLEKEGENKWILRYYTVEEALDNLGFTDEEKEEFYNFKDVNDKFDEENQFKDYTVSFKFKL